MLLKFTEDAWKDYCYWQSQDKKTLKRINTLIKEIQRDPFAGIGKPEPLKYDFQYHISYSNLIKSISYDVENYN